MSIPEDWHTLGATVFVVLLTIAVIIGVAYYRYQVCLDTGFSEDQCWFLTIERCSGE